MTTAYPNIPIFNITALLFAPGGACRHIKLRAIGALALLLCFFARGQAILNSDSRSVSTSGGFIQAPDAFGEYWPEGYLDVPQYSDGTESAELIAAQNSGVTDNGYTIEGSGDAFFLQYNDYAGGSAQSSLDLQFTVANPVYYGFSCSCSGSPNTCLVSFSGVPGGGVGVQGTEGPRFGFGTMVPGINYRIYANCGAQWGWTSGAWKFELNLSDTPSRYTPQQAQALGIASSYAGSASLGLGLAGLAGLTTGGIGTLLIAGSALLGGISEETHLLSLDPPDTNFTVIAKPVFPSLPLVTPGTNVTQAEAASLNAWITDLGQAWAYSQALYTSINRSSGAAAATNAFWQNAQLNAIQLYEPQLAALLSQEPVLRSNALVQLQLDGYPSVSFSTSNAMAIITGIAAGNGMPAIWQTELTRLGWNSTTISNYEDSLLGIDPTSVAGTFPASLANTNLDAGMAAAASALWYSSPVLLNVRRLPGGELCFDVSTMSGFSYTVQSTQDLKNTNNWTSIFSTPGTGKLISITNSPQAGSKAGFYRVVHD